MNSHKLGENAELFHGNNTNIIKTFKKNSIDLTVTSPPYDNLKNYKKTIDCWTFKEFKKIANELYRVTKEHGVVVWVVCDATLNGSETGSSFRQVLYFKKIGFNIHDTMIYSKYPIIPLENPRQMNIFEYMFVLSKGKVKTFNPRLKKSANLSNRTQNYKNLHTPEQEVTQYKKSKKRKKYKTDSNIWQYNIAKTIHTKDHPATFPIELALDHILTWTNEEAVIFDPFMGSGTVGMASVLTNRKFKGTERVSDFFDLSLRNIKSEIERPRFFKTLEDFFIKEQK